MVFRFLLVTFLSIGVPLFAAVKMIPLDDYMESKNVADPNVIFYVSARCSAINLNMADLTENRKEKDLYRKGLEAGEAFGRLAAETRQIIIPNDSPEENLRITLETIGTIANEYVKIMNENYPKTGVYFTDWMMDDYTSCSYLYNQGINDNN